MHRMQELIDAVRKKHPDDHFFHSFEEEFLSQPQMRSAYEAYDQAFSCLDQESWETLSCKAIKHFTDHRIGQLKQGFFNQLNEAFAYAFLKNYPGISCVSVLKERKGQSTPDLKFCVDATSYFCEVKTIGISEEEIARWKREQSFDLAIYRELSEGFLNKLNMTLSQAQKQISSQNSTGLVFVVLTFDDFTLDHYERYKAQISDLLTKQHTVPDVYIKVGLLGNTRIVKGAFSLEPEITTLDYL